MSDARLGPAVSNLLLVLLLSVLDCGRPTNLMMVAAEPRLLQGPSKSPRRLSRECFANAQLDEFVSKFGRIGMVSKT